MESSLTRTIVVPLLLMLLTFGKIYHRHQRNEARRNAHPTQADYQADSARFKQQGINVSPDVLQATDTDSLPEFGDVGGTVTLDLMGKPVNLAMRPGAMMKCRDHGQDGLGLVLSNDNSVFAMSQPESVVRVNGRLDYAALEHKTFPVMLEQPKPHVTLPGMGDYAVTSGTVTIDDVQYGKRGNTLWTGKLALALHTARGDIPVQGQFRNIVYHGGAEDSEE